ncbi:MAG: hypothetical protein K2X66_11140 [Cyanobacteria bacterium]|nr:hypothetical protein [Cyanobacteriota bacterium]
MANQTGSHTGYEKRVIVQKSETAYLSDSNIPIRPVIQQIPNDLLQEPREHLSLQKKILEAVVQKKDQVISFPRLYPTSSFYSFAALAGKQLGIVVCLDRLSLERNLLQLKSNGLEFPEIVTMDGTMMPHQEREVMDLIKNHQVLLIYTLPHQFSALSFLRFLVNVPIGFIAIEHAQCLLPGYTSSGAYIRIAKALDSIQQRPPLMLLTQLISDTKTITLMHKLKAEKAQVIEQKPLFHKTGLYVKKCVTEKQKMNYLFQVLKGNAPELPFSWERKGVNSPGSVIIQTNSIRQAEKLANRLVSLGFGDVYAYHSGQDVSESLSIEKIFSQTEHCIVVTNQHGAQFLKPPPNNMIQWVYWHPPTSLEDVFHQVFQATHEDNFNISALFLYTKEDYVYLQNRILAHDWDLDVEALDAKRKAEMSSLTKFKQWVFTNRCRHQGLITQILDRDDPKSQDCKVCDRCRSHLFSGVLDGFLKYWLY